MHNSVLKLISRRSALFAIAAVAALAAGAAFASHGHDEGGGHGQGASIGSPGNASAVDRTVEIEAGDIYFKPDSLEIKPGETVRFVIHNEGKLLHEFNIGTHAMHEEHQKEMREMMEQGMLTATGIKHMQESMGQMQGREHMEEGMEHGENMPMRHNDPNSVVIEPGETKELIWTFPKGGKLQFACNMPGHYEAGMHGPIEIQK